MGFWCANSIVVLLVVILGFTVPSNGKSFDMLIAVQAAVNTTVDKSLKIEVKPLIPAPSNPIQWPA